MLNLITDFSLGLLLTPIMDLYVFKLKLNA